MNNDALTIASWCHSFLPLESAYLGDEYYYQSLPLCLIDAVFSIRTQYKAAQNVVSRYCRHFELRQFREGRTSTPPPREQQESISSFLTHYEELGVGGMTEDVFNNRQQLPAGSGVLKSELAMEFGYVLVDNDIQYFEDVTPGLVDKEKLEREIQRASRQKMHALLKYFWMLAGHDDLAKPDQWVLEFLTLTLRRTVTAREVQALLTEATDYLRPSFPQMTVRLLDHEIWKYQRDLPRTRAMPQSTWR
ncbi:hypothetical protein GCT13_37640 [Paraburkholderia sp. CNPSo 3157]|uniref:Uncharacterized protein n=1 Tax=Paraburkholderia franconis TaxID=2654983 RepID=A0A7X1NIR4_9BURK|nr:hypothetical protein [Paraburkholderia franconis]MPW22401.1 hypothetical protein [Paraburkholderia franconis]